ncbi:MAG: hypothetical protein WCK09_08405 [Bacteroidota bacterium]
MKKMFFLSLLVIFCLSGTSIYATKWRVNNAGIPADFTTASAAVNSPLVSNGDTVYFESSMFSYGSVNFQKRLVVIGPGYFLGENDSTQAGLKPATLDQCSFSPGSEGTIVKGMTMTGYFYISTSNITFEKNMIDNLQINAGSGSVILRNYIVTMGVNMAQNVLISNNIITSVEQFANGFLVNVNASATVMNNIFLGKVYVRNSVFRNNICTATSLSAPMFSGLNSIVENNIGASTQFGSLNGNQENVDMTTVFTYTGSTDGKYKLKPGSPAIAAGAGGVDCGAFGGNYPYTLSGMVSGPSVWYMNMNGIDVTVKAKSH